MTDSFIKKNAKLHLDFDRYAMSHPGVYDNIPNGASIILAVKGDSNFNRQSKSIIKSPWIKKQIGKQKVVIAEKQGRTWLVKEMPRKQYATA